MKKFNWVAFWLLGAVTCGIYPLYVWYKMDKNMKEMADTVGEVEYKNEWSFIVFSLLLGAITCGFLSTIWIYKHFRAQSAIAAKVGVKLSPTKDPYYMLLIASIPIYSFYVVCANHNALVDAIEGAKA